MKIQRLIKRFCFFKGVMVLGCLILLNAETSIIEVNAQTAGKTISLAYSRKPQLNFKDVKVGQNSIKFNESFNEDEDWLKRLSFNLENISGKPIVFLTVDVNFPETRSTGPMMAYPISFGQRPGSIHRQQKPLLLKPKEVLEVHLSERYESLIKFINERQPIGTLGKIELVINFIVFENGIAWNTGDFMKQDPDNPNRYTPIEKFE